MIQQSEGLKDSSELNTGELQIRNNAIFKWENDAIAKRYNSDKKETTKEKTEQKTSEKDSDDVISKEEFLSQVDVKITDGEFLAVVGKVGSGKSSLMLSLMGELNIVQGECLKNGKIAYIAQEAFLINETIRENITFGLVYDKTRYE
jgi:ABC-type multidrug transport system fused ATPase/permease subunit